MLCQLPKHQCMFYSSPAVRSARRVVWIFYIANVSECNYVVKMLLSNAMSRYLFFAIR